MVSPLSLAVVLSKLALINNESRQIRMIYEFSDLTLDLDRHLLTRGGRSIKLTKLSFKVLQALVQAAPALISHDELMDQVWGPKRVITPKNLGRAEVFDTSRSCGNLIAVRPRFFIQSSRRRLQRAGVSVAKTGSNRGF